jgi:hypothetical protein
MILSIHSLVIVDKYLSLKSLVLDNKLKPQKMP